MMGPPQLSHGAAAQTTPKPRVVVTADPELDDSNSLVRYLLYSTDFQTEGVGTYPGQVMLSNPTSLNSSMQVPADAMAGQTIHLILEATDNGTPALTRYQRIVVSVSR